MRGFRAWYLDGSVYAGSTVEEWKALPSSGLCAVVRYNEQGRTIFDGADWIYWEGGDIHYVASGEWGTNQPPPDNVSCVDCIKDCRDTAMTDDDFMALVARYRDAVSFP